MTPIVRLELSVDELRHHVVHALVVHQKEVQDIVNQRIRAYIETGAMAAKIEASVDRHLNDAIDSGVKRAITAWTRSSPTVAQAVEDAVRDALWNREEAQ